MASELPESPDSRVADHFKDQSSSYTQLLLASLTALFKGEADFRPNAGPAWAESSKASKVRPRGLVCSILRGIFWSHRFSAELYAKSATKLIRRSDAVQSIPQR